MRVLFCGSREWGIITADEAQKRRAWREIHAIEGWLLRLRQHKDVIITGGARGADQIAEELASRMGFEMLVFKAEWEKYGKAAGSRRNAQMLSEGRPDLVVAFHSDLRRSKGTLDMVRRARKAGVKVIWMRGGECMSAHGEKNYTRSLRDEIKAKQEELKALKARSKEERDAKKSTRDETKTSRGRLSAQAKFLLEEAQAQVDMAVQLLDGLFGKRELVEEFQAYFELRQERLAALKAAGKKKSKKKTETPPAAE